MISHHRDVPYRALNVIADKSLCDSDGGDGGNLIIHGDNLEALKSLLPEYEGRVNCIYIDPPYNTGEEKWVYNDNVNDPRIQSWIGEVVGPEGQDLTRHDKWLCMMYPRLRLLRELLADDGFIAVSINDIEVANLGLLLDEIFGAGNRLACAPWRAEKSGGKGKTALRTGHEYIYFYRKGPDCLIKLEEKEIGVLNLRDKFGPYKKGRELNKWGAGSLRADRETMWFPLVAPDGSEVYPIRNDGCEGRWRLGADNSLIKAILADPDNAHWELNRYDEGVSVDGKTERWVPYQKIREETKSFGWNTWLDGYGTNSDATAELKALFGSKVFDTPKPVELVKWIVSLAYDDAVILDSFAGSGTTAEAVLKLNAEDRGTRSFILVEMMGYADSITAERVRKVITGYDNLSPKKAKNAPDHFEALGGGFRFCELGEPLFAADGSLDGAAGVEEVMRYIWYTETKAPYVNRTDECPYLIGELNGTCYYLAYVPGCETVLSYDLLSKLPVKRETTVVYADRCVIDDAILERYGIRFKQIPRQIAKV